MSKTKTARLNGLLFLIFSLCAGVIWAQFPTQSYQNTGPQYSPAPYSPAPSTGLVNPSPVQSPVDSPIQNPYYSVPASVPASVHTFAPTQTTTSSPFLPAEQPPASLTNPGYSPSNTQNFQSAPGMTSGAPLVNGNPAASQPLPLMPSTPPQSPAQSLTPYSPLSEPLIQDFPAMMPVTTPITMQETTPSMVQEEQASLPFSASSSSSFQPPVTSSLPDASTPLLPPTSLPSTAFPPVNLPPPSLPSSVSVMPDAFPPPPETQQTEPLSYAEKLHTQKSEAVLSAEEEVRKYEAIEQARKGKGNVPSWMLPLPDSRGPFLSRLENQSKSSPVVPVSHMDFEMYDKALEQNKIAYSWEKDDDKGFDWMLLDPITFFNKSKEWVGLGPDQKKAEAAMEEGRKFMSDGKFSVAGKKFETAAKRWPDTVLEEDARYFAGECYYQSKEYYRAYENFDRLLSNFQSKHKNAAVARLYEIAGYWIKKTESGSAYFNVTDKSRPSFDTFGAAEKAYKSIIFNDNRGPYYDRSMLQLGFAYMNQGKKQGDSQFREAARWFQQLRENAINHEYASRASYLEVYCRKMAVDGAEYDSSHLLEAKELADMSLTQFGSGSSEKENRENLIQMRNEISEKEAEHYWTLAQYYEKGKHYAAARMQYQHILKEHPTTNFAQKSKDRLDAIKGFPDNPPNFSEQLKSMISWGGKEK